MRQVLAKLQDDLTWFVDDRETLAMVLECTSTEVPHVTKLLEIVEAEHECDVFLLFAHSVEADDDAHAYVTKVVDNVDVQRAGVNEARAQDDRPPWDALPAACHDLQLTPSARLIAVLQWVREQIPNTDNHIVFGLLPVEIDNHAAYAGAVQGLLPGDELERWMAGCRFVFRDDRQRPVLIPYAQENPSDWVILYEGLDLSPGALAQSLVDLTEDSSAPEGERVVALVQLAAMDFSHRRYGDAYRKWGSLFEYYARKDVPQMQALCLCGAADVLRVTGKLEQAKETYQQGLAYTREPEHLAVALNLLLGVGEVCITLEHWEDAEGYLHLAEQIAATGRLLFPQCDIMARRGVPLVALGRLDDAQTLWRACVDMTRLMQDYPRCIATLEQLIAFFRARQRPAQVREHEAELDDVRAEQRKQAQA